MRRICTVLIIIVAISFSQGVDYKQIPDQNTFILVIDKSGSMSGKSIKDTKAGALKFISQLKKEDKVGLITFSNDITVEVPITANRQEINFAIKNISVGGATKLNDALASGVKQLINNSGRRIIIYLTDGKDNGSNFSLENLESMFQGEDIYAYGIGVGNVDTDLLRKVNEATGGSFLTVSASNTTILETIYSDVLLSFYNNYTNKITSNGALIVKSRPEGKIVKINGKNAGITPLKLTNLPPGEIDVVVHFDSDKVWNQIVLIKGGYTALVNSREKDALKNLWIISKPHGASIFINGEYVGYTSNEIVDEKKRKWYKKVITNPKELKVVALKPGIYKIEIIGFPDFDYGPDQKVVVDYLLEDDDIICINIFSNILINKTGKEISGEPRADIFGF